MSSSENNQTNIENNEIQTSDQSASQSTMQGTSGSDSSDGSKKPPVLLIILILLILSIVSIFGYMIAKAIHDDAIDESIAAEQLQAAESRAQLTLDSDGNVITQDTVTDGNSTSAITNSFINKLVKSEPVSILIIGDVYGTGAGASDGSNWTDILSSDIKDTFGSEASINNLSLSGGNDAYSAYVTLMNESAGNPSSNYDAVIISLGYYDDPFKFNIQYEGLLRSITQRYPSAQIIGIIESAAVTDMDGHSDETAIYTRTLLEHYDGIVANMGEAFAVNGTNTKMFTDDGILPNEKGQKVYSSWIVKQIQSRLSNEDNSYGSDTASASTLAADGSISPVNADAVLYDHYYYISENSFQRLDDINYIIGVQDLTALGAETAGLIGLDYDYINGSNIAQIVIDGSIFGGLTADYEGASPERHIVAVRNNAIITDHIAVSFATKEQADSFHGIIITGNMNLSKAAEKYKKLPLPPETTAAPVESETDVTESSATETSEAEAETSEAETQTPAQAESEKATKAETQTSAQTESAAEETKKTASDTKKSKNSTKKSGNTKKQTTAADSNNAGTDAQGTSDSSDVVESSSTVESAAIETTAVGTTVDISQGANATESAPAETQNSLESVIISDPSNSASIFETTTAYTVEAGQGIDLEQWNSIGPSAG